MFCVCIVFVVVLMFFSGLHSAMTIWVYGIFLEGGIDPVSLFCMGCINDVFIVLMLIISVVYC